MIYPEAFYMGITLHIYIYHIIIYIYIMYLHIVLSALQGNKMAEMCEH